jgi:hypothetical protein
MKKLVIAALLGFGFMLAMPSCVDDAGADCKYCYIRITDVDGNLIEEGTPEEYCGSDLDDIDGESTTDADGNTSEWICDAASKK